MRKAGAQLPPANLEVVVGGAASAALHRVRWSRGRSGAPRWLAYGGAAGLVRVTIC